MKEKIDEILEEHISEEDERMEFRLVVYDYMAMRGKILTLIQEAENNAVLEYAFRPLNMTEAVALSTLKDEETRRTIEHIKRDAVEGFVEWYEKEYPDGVWSDKDMLIEEYLESEGVKSNEKDGLYATYRTFLGIDQDGNGVWKETTCFTGGTSERLIREKPEPTKKVDTKKGYMEIHNPKQFIKDLEKFK